MSDIIPPLLSNTPPPPPLTEEDEDDEFGDFTGAIDISYGCDNLSLPPSPVHTPDAVSILKDGLDINSNAEKNKISQIDHGADKDFQDKRKIEENFSEHTNSINNSCIEDVHNKELFFEHSINDDFHIALSSTKNNLEEYKAPLDPNECIKSEKEGNLESSVNKNDSNGKIHEINQDPEAVTKNFENESDGFVNNDCETEEIVDKTSISDLGTNSDKVENIILEDKENGSDVILDNIENGDSIPISSVLELTEINCENSEDIKDNCVKEQHVVKSKSITDEIITRDVISNDQEDVTSDNFTFDNKPEYSSIEVKNESEIKDDFAEAAFDKTEQKELNSKSDFDDDHFGDFSSHSLFPDSSADKHVAEDDEFDDDFGEFAFTTAPAVEPEWGNACSSTQDDDFGDFADFSEIAKEPIVLTLNEKQAFEKAEAIIKEMFPSTDTPQDDFIYVDVEKDDIVFNELKDITETPALLYQWSKSSSQNLLLKSLNIDARNILYGPPWNPSMPRFAANLGPKPLEPVKSEILTPTPSKSSPSITVQSASIDIPNAQFDWNSSGLVNPLDSVSKENPGPVSPTDVTSKPLDLSIEPSLILQAKSSSPQDESRREPSKSDLEQKIDDFEDFTSFQSSQVSQSISWPSVPLRETYISNDNVSANTSKEIPLDIENWLQPTIVTPELPRKDLSLGDEELPNVQTPELSRKEVPRESLDDDFDDFKMSLPNEQSTNTDTPANAGVLEPTKPEINWMGNSNMRQEDLPGQNSVKNGEKTKIKEEPNKRSLELEVVEEKIVRSADEDEEFTDFHSFTPVAQKSTPPILEPLKPMLVYPTVQYPTMATSQINWPDPGITDEEIKKFEIVFSQSQMSKPEPPKKEEPQTSNGKEAASIADDDEWSDFVSVQKPSPVHKFQSSERENTSSPDLPLSVLNLGNIQPAKQPIPVITPHGLVQTKLSSNNPVNMSPKTHLKLAPQQKVTNHSQPSIISNQFATQAYNFNANSYPKRSKAALNASTFNSGGFGNQKSLDDEDWSEFVSSPLPPSTSNGYQHPGWPNPSPNIIMNPGHFVQTSSDVRNRKVPNYPLTNKKNTVSNIPMPDLEFIAPKARTSNSRRK